MGLGRRAGWIYLFAFVLACGLGFAGLFCVAGTDWFLRHDGYPALRNIGYSMRAKGLNCQIVLYGDSAALTGLDPRIVSKETGLTACNVAEGSTIQLVVGSDLPLRAYLDQNEPPRMIVGMWSYASFRPDLPPHTLYTTEGMAYALQYMNRAALLRMLVRSGHPHWVPRFLLWAANSLEYRASGGDARAAREREDGLYQFPLPPETTCLRNAPVYGGAAAAERAWPDGVSAFRSKYTTAKTAVLVDISPIPECNRYLPQFRHATRGLHDNAFQAVPIQYFNEGDLHFNPAGSRFISEQVGSQIRAALKR